MQSIGTRNIVLGILGLGIIFSALIFKTDGSTHNIFSDKTENLLVSDVVRKERDTDSDGDGVPDWKELLIGTDPHNPNTFNIEGGDLAYMQARETSSSGIQVQYDPQTGNLTEQIGRSTFGEYILVRSGDHQTGYGSPEDLVATITQFGLRNTQPTIVAKKDFTIVTSNRSALLLYAQVMTGIETKYPDSVMRGLSDTIVKALSVENITDEHMKNHLDFYITLCENIIKELTSAAVPNIVTNEHINLTNSVYGLKWSLEQLTLIDTDPARALIGIQLIPEYGTTMNEVYKAIIAKLKQENIAL